MNDEQWRALLRRAEPTDALPPPDPAFAERIAGALRRRRRGQILGGAATLAVLAGLALGPGLGPASKPGDAEFAALRQRIDELETRVAALLAAPPPPTRPQLEAALAEEEAASALLWRAGKLAGAEALARYALVDQLFPHTVSAAAARQRLGRSEPREEKL